MEQAYTLLEPRLSFHTLIYFYFFKSSKLLIVEKFCANLKLQPNV